LTVDEAKRRLREAAKRASPASWVGNNPWDAIAIAFASGLLAGSEPAARKPLATALAQLMSNELISAVRFDDASER